MKPKINQYGDKIDQLSGKVSIAAGSNIVENMTSFTSHEGKFIVSTGLIPNRRLFSTRRYIKKTSIHLLDENGLSHYYLGCTH